MYCAQSASADIDRIAAATAKPRTSRPGRNVFEAAARAGVGQIIYTSSIAAYGVTPGHPDPLYEDAPRKRVEGPDPYGINDLPDDVYEQYDYQILSKFNKRKLVREAKAASENSSLPANTATSKAK